MARAEGPCLGQNEGRKQSNRCCLPKHVSRKVQQAQHEQTQRGTKYQSNHNKKRRSGQTFTFSTTESLQMVLTSSTKYHEES